MGAIHQFEADDIPLVVDDDKTCFLFKVRCRKSSFIVGVDLVDLP